MTFLAVPRRSRLSTLLPNLFALAILVLPVIARAATIEVVDIWGNPASEFGYYHPLRFRVVDAAANNPAVVDQITVDVTVQSGEIETVACREVDRTSGVFEGEIKAYEYGAAYSQSGGLQIAADEVATVTYESGLGPITAQATSRLVQVDFVDADGRPLAAVGEGEVLHVELLGPNESNDIWQRDTLPVVITRTGTSDSETVELLETANASGLYVGSLRMARDFQGASAGILDPGSLPATVSVAYSRDFAPFLTSVGTASVVGAKIEIIDVYGNQVESISTELRARLREHFFEQSWGLEEIAVQVSNDLSGDLEQMLLREVSPGVFESATAMPLTAAGGTTYDGQLSVPAGSVTTVSYTLPSTDTVSAEVPTGPWLTLLHRDGTPATSFLHGEPLRFEVRDAGADVSAARDTVTVDVYSDIAADFETVVLTETSENSGIFRGLIETVFVAYAGSPANGTVEEGFGYYFSDDIHVVYSGGVASVQMDAAIEFPRIEALDAAGKPVTALGAGATLRLRVTDFSVGSAGNSDNLVIEAGCSGSGYDYEQIVLRETAADSFIFEADLPVRFGGSIYGNKKLECSGAGEVVLTYADNIYPYEYWTLVELLDAKIEFLDEEGLPTSEVLDGRRAKLRLTGSVENPQPLVFDTATVVVTSRNTLDSESVVLRETTVSSGIFEGEVWIASQQTGNPQVDVVVGAAPLYARDQISATYFGIESVANVATARLSLLDEAGREITSVRPDSYFFVRIDMPSFGSPSQVEELYGSYSWAPGAAQSFLATETSAGSGIFLGSIWLGSESAQPGGQLGVFYDTSNEVLSRVVPIVAYQVRFLDAAAAEITSLPVGRPIRLELWRPQSLDNTGQWDQLEVVLRSEVSGDYELLTLYEEESSWAGPLRGSLPMMASEVYLYDGTFEAGINYPFGDTVSVELSGAPGILASAPLRRPQVRFEKVNGNEVSELVLGQIYAVEVEDSVLDTSTGIESVSVYLSSTYGSAMWLELWETGPSTGIFRGEFMPNDPYAGTPPPDVPQISVTDGEELSALHTFSSGTGSAEAIAAIARRGELEILDAGGNPVSSVLEGAPIRIRFTDLSNNSWPPDLRTVTVGSRLGGDIETLDMWETAIGSGIFERTLPSRFWLGAGAQSEDGELGLAADPQLQIATGESVVVHYEDPYSQDQLEISLPTTAAHFSVLEPDGSTAVAVYPDYDHPLTLHLESPTLARAGQTASFVVTSSNGDLETYNVSGSASGVFETTVHFDPDYYGSSGDGVVWASPGATVTFRYELSYGHQGTLEETLPVAGAILHFVDPSSGNGLARAPDVRPFKVQLLDSSHDAYQIETRTVTLATTLGQDSEDIVLTETNPYSGVFEAIVQPRLQAGSQAGATILVGRLITPVGGGIYDQVTATHLYGGSQEISVSLPLDGPRVLWTDAAGKEAATIQWGSDAYVLIDDASRDLDPGLADTITVTLDEMPYGNESLTLTETGPSTGIFRGSIPVVLGSPSTNDGQLQVLEFGTTRVVYAMPGIGSLSRSATVTGLHLTFIDAAGNETTSYLEGETLRLRLRRSDLSGGSPTEIDITSVQVQSLYWGLDSENVTLTETAVASGIFEGSIDSRLAPAELYNGILEFGRGSSLDVITATYGTSGEAGARVNLSGGTMRLVDRVGRSLTGLLGGQILGVELHRLVGGDPAQVDTLVDAIELDSLGVYSSDSESLTLVETGPDTGVYVGTIETSFGPAGANDGILQVDYQGTARASYQDLSSTLEVSVPLLYGQAPVAESDFLEMAAGTSAPLDVLANDNDPDGGPLTLVGTISGAFVSASIESDNTLILTTAANAAGYETLTYLVSDQSGAISEGVVYLYYDTPPTVTITLPEPATVFASQSDVGLAATATDLDDGDISSSIEWSSDLQGLITYGASLSIPAEYLQVGTHQITASVMDSRGYVGTDTVTIVIDGAPILDVLVPAEIGAPLQQGANTWSATANDLEDGDLGASVVWTSLNHGPLGIGAEIAVELEPGGDLITASVTDSQGNTISVERNIYVNARPTVEITNPAEGALLPEAEFYEFWASVDDPDEYNNLLVEWTLDGEILPSTYQVTAVDFLEPGPHSLSARVADSYGGEASDSVTFTVLGLPTLMITTPVEVVDITLGESLDLAATASDFEDGDLSAQVAWVSDLDGPLGVGATLEVPNLTAGGHTVTASVADSDGFEASATVYVNVQLPPSINLFSPLTGAVYAPGNPVECAATASDPDQGDLTSEIVWSSNVDGVLGSGGSLSLTTLSQGTHLLTATVTDFFGGAASESVTITIVNANTSPVVNITSPSSGVWVAVGESVDFTASALDAESGDITSSLVWTSSLDGAIGSGASFQTSGLSAGSHTISAAALDPQGAAGSASVTVEVKVVQTATFISAGPLDGFVLESTETSGVGGIASTGQLRLGDDKKRKQYRSFLSFDTSALPDTAVVRQVTVRAYRSGTTGTNPATTHGDLLVDVKTGYFGSSSALQSDDFADLATVEASCVVTPAAANGQWSVGILDAAGRAALSLDSTTQIRLRFTIEDDGDNGNDYLDHYGGESTVASTRPQLVVEYLE